ncbi:hypothetical protein PBCV1_a626L [Paramecium bursaria Chlorella virus 1]|uniref:Uncharacterized protein n=2 Tax=Chlorovirus TaxID=181083 RepID=O41108_PBCV1|nr:hypothetical protein PBCV1_a626L [Paramecium bursaria Chlorella virus 1]YP_001498026.1 hypothetical protein NY2A_b830L [Paramecium bursaria Chlorella virus NY2A]YP_001498827.1 hypothetical protein AR158_C746L [Paramecium bursaria Chlorella virus AR158]AAC97028.1 hypothetical protein [Paramecium bursaria Chlorella virus 1]ABT15229.1 hypothetical protein NY2A_b830L [Paramecium bursaria Chlorella virus NY2A]ABU44291.1 hypothetical protein AR158_C746L [Paramecium bursaria Chlorella virus AR158]
MGFVVWVFVVLYTGTSNQWSPYGSLCILHSASGLPSNGTEPKYLTCPRFLGKMMRTPSLCFRCVPIPREKPHFR